MTRSLNDTRRHVQVLEERVGAVANSEFPGHYIGEDHSWSLEKFKNDLHVQIQRLTPSTVSFDLVGVDSSIANALRRIMISEVPTVAIEKVYSYANSTIVQDEVLAQRLGLVPIKFDPRKLKYREPADLEAVDSSAGVTDENTLVFTLTLACSRSRDPNLSRHETDPAKLYVNSSVYSGQMIWDPKGRQIRNWNIKPDVGSPEEIEVKAAKKAMKASRKGKKGKAKKSSDAMDVDEEEAMAAGGAESDLDDPDVNEFGQPWSQPPRPANDDILLAKMRPGQEITMLLYCQKSNGKDHAKYSPVATASYRLLPHITILSQPPPHLAEKFQNCFPPGVIDLQYDPATGENTKAVVANPRLDTVTREVLRHDEFKEIVRLGRIRDFYIYEVESTGAYDPEELLPEAIKVFQTKLDDVEACLRAAYPSHAPGYDPSA